MQKWRKFLGLFKKQKAADINYLELTPYRKYTHEPRDEDTIDVLVPRFNDKILGKIFQPKLKNPYIKANFDKLGTAVWLEIDGKTNVDNIIMKVKEKLGEEVNPAYERVTMFLSQLHRNGFIDFHEFNKG